MRIYHISSRIVLAKFGDNEKKRYLKQGIPEELIDININRFDLIRKAKYRELYDEIENVIIPKERRHDISAYIEFDQLLRVVNYVRGKRQTEKQSAKKDDPVGVPPVFENDKLAIYRGDSPSECIKIKGDFNYTWCVCAKGASNMYNYYHYKEGNPTFYFVKSKVLEQNHPYFFFALQVTDKNQYIVSRSLNDGDNRRSWEEIIGFQPDLDGLKNVFVHKPLKQNEKDLFQKYDYNPISDENFKALSYEDREIYLDMFAQKRPISDNIFQELPDDLKSRYIDYELGLENAKFNNIKDNKRLFRRYEQITRRKIDKFIVQKKERTNIYTEIKLSESELDVLGKENTKLLFENIDDNNIVNLINSYSKDKDELIKSVIYSKGEKLKDTTIKSLLPHCKNIDEISILIIEAKKTSLTSNDVVEILRYSKDKDSTIEAIFDNKESLKDISNLPLFISHAKDKNRIANRFLQNISKDKINSLSNQSVTILINSINDKKSIFNLIGKEKISQLNDNFINEIILSNMSDEIIDLIIAYKENNLSGNTTFIILKKYNKISEVAKKLGSTNINKLSDKDVNNLLSGINSEAILNELFKYKELTHANVYSVLKFSDDLEKAIMKLGPEEIRKLTDEEANSLILSSKNRVKISEILLKYRRNEEQVSSESKINSSESVYDQKVYNIFLNIYKNIIWKQRSNWIAKDSAYYSIFTGTNASAPTAIPSYVMKINIQKDYQNVTIALLLNKTMSASLENLSDVTKITMNNIDSMELKTYIMNRFGFDIKLPYEFKKEVKINQKVRLTRSKNGKMTSLEIYVVPKQISGYEIYYEVKNIQTSALELRKTVKDKNENGTELTTAQASRIFNAYVEQAKNVGYRDQSSREYIPEGISDMSISEMEKDMNPKPKIPETPVKNKKVKTAQNFEGFYSGNIPDYATQFLGTTAVEASQIKSMFAKANEAIDLVNQFDSSLLYNISFIFNFSKGGAYGVYLSELDRAIKTKALQNKLEQKGYTVQSTDQGLTAFPKDNKEIAPDQIQQDIDSIYKDLESKGGTAIGINMGAVLNAAKQDAMESGSKDPEMWQWIAILHLGGTIAHEAVHAKGNRGEGPSEQIEQAFTNWALPKINELYKRSMESQGKSEEYTPLIVTNRQRHANCKSWYKKAQLSYYLPVSFSNDAIGSDLNGRFPDNLHSDVGWSMLAQQDQGVPLENRLGKQFMSKIPKNLDQEHDSLEEQLRKYTKDDEKLDPNASMEELLSEGWDEDRGYISLEGLLDEKRPKPLMIPIDKSAANSFNLKKYALKFPVYNRSWLTDVASTTNDINILKNILKKDKDDDVSRAAASNPNCPSDILAEVLKRGKNDWVSCKAAENLNCPKEVLIEVLKRGKDDWVSRFASKNPNCPQIAIIEWKHKTGDIVQHEHKQYKLEDKDVERYNLNQFAKKKINLNKYAQNEDWYTIEIARTTKDPKILTDILRREKDDDVSYYAAQNKNCPKEILEEVLRRGKDDLVSRYVARNPNCPPEILIEVLRREKDDDVSQNAADNPNCPPEMLTEVLRRRKNDLVSQYAAFNRNCPPEALSEVLRRGKNDEVSEYASENPNCPLEEKIKWMQVTGQIEKEDESKGHIIEYENKKEDNFEDLKKLLGSDFNLNKYAQNEKWYTREIARTTKDPKILTDILRKGENDWVSCAAAENPNCPPEILTEVLRRENEDNVSEYAAKNPNCTSEILVEILKRGKDDWVSRSAAENPNCPSEILTEVLRRDKDDWVSYEAASNTNCPSYILVEILKRGKNDDVSQYASENPNCPPEAKIKWMQVTGQIEKEDESKGHIIEYENKKEDNFEDLKKLLGNNKNMIKTATLFGWMNNLEISDGSTIPGLSDRVMAWDDRDECFSEEEEWIKQQPRYNPNYDIKGFYYRWIEPRFQPQLFNDMTSDYSNTHPAKRFASKITPELSKILSILSRAKSKINNKDIKCTRFIATNDMMPIIDKIFDSNTFKINVFYCDNIDDNEIYSIWISSPDVNEEIIEKVEKHLQKKSIEKDIDKIVDDLIGISKQTENSIKHIVELTKDVCNMYDFNMPNTDVSEDKIIFIIDNLDQCLKLGGIVAEKLGIIDVNINLNLLSFKYKNIEVIFSKNKEI